MSVLEHYRWDTASVAASPTPFSLEVSRAVERQITRVAKITISDGDS
jgi:hypothetical protein